ncbi:MAG: peptide deformylase [Candidatus Melainabacteria bacterium]|nr:peptide deformylase [Candidatus Melainabacteria bacterium]
MPILQVHKYPDPILKQVSKEVISFDSSLEAFIKNGIETLQNYKFCVGLSAPQVGNLQRITFVDISRARKPHPNNGLLILINPRILASSDFKIVREGCLSIPDFTANVKRAMKIVVAYQDIKGKTRTLSTKNFEAHAIQHEIDHLNGILFLDKIANPASDLFRRVRY